MFCCLNVQCVPPVAVTGLAQICHRYEVPLIVDEAHGSHLAFHPAFPQVIWLTMWSCAVLEQQIFLQDTSKPLMPEELMDCCLNESLSCFCWCEPTDHYLTDAHVTMLANIPLNLQCKAYTCSSWSKPEPLHAFMQLHHHRVMASC